MKLTVRDIKYNSSFNVCPSHNFNISINLDKMEFICVTVHYTPSTLHTQVEVKSEKNMH